MIIILFVFAYITMGGSFYINENLKVNFELNKLYPNKYKRILLYK